MKRALAVLMLAAWAAFAFAPVAQAACPKTSLLAIQDEVMCVICGVPLINAGGPQSDDERNFIRQHAAKCESKEEIKAALVAEYGPKVLAMPQKSGFDLTAYVVPVIVLLAALIGIGAGAISWRRNRDDAAAATGSTAGDEELDADLQRYDL